MGGLLDDNMEPVPLIASIAALGVSLSFSLWVCLSSLRSNKVRHHTIRREDENSLGSLENGEAEMGFLSADKDNAHPSAVVLMSWRIVCCSYPTKKNHELDSVKTLNNSFGEVLSGEVTAIMGPSGGGKTTLLNILSGRKAVGSITGEVSILGKTSVLHEGIHQVGHTVAYVPQNENFFPMQTPEEAVEFVAKLRHGPKEYEQSEIHTALREVGLGDPTLYARPIGGELAGGLSVVGLSGGEKKRLALACALILKPKIIMLDEITSGLDSKNALIIMNRIKQVCIRRQVAAVIVIHQPNGYIFEIFDRLILLSEGETIYSGRVSNLDALYEHHFGCSIPQSKHELPVDLLERSQKCESPIAAPFLDTSFRHSVEPSTKMSTAKVSSFSKFCTVFHRNLLNHYVRNYTNMLARLFCYGACSVLDGAIFWDIGSGGRNSSMIGAFTFILLMSYLLPFATIPVFVHDKKFFLFERSLGLYSPWIYCASQALLEMWVLILASLVQAVVVIPMAGIWNDDWPNWATFFTIHACISASGLTGSALVLFFAILFPSQDLAFIAGSGAVSLSLGMSGGFVPFPEIRSFVAWLQWISPCKYSLQALALTYFSDDGSEGFLVSTEMDRPSTISANIGALFLMYISLAIASIAILSQMREVR
mmetsp:Transcript_15117/g.28657  ORF Transcript_15117/g.28657 Transcript_15117/m.28657 type:complete len:651 (+) Transcript_15117:245-2197(+)